MSNKLAEIKAALEASTQGKWEWRGRIAPDWMPDTFGAVDDLRVEIPTPEKKTDADLWFVLQATKSGFMMVRNADAQLIANAPEYLRTLIEAVELMHRYIHETQQENWLNRDYLQPEMDAILEKLGLK